MFLSDKDVAERYKVGRSTIWTWAKTEPGFPAPISLTAGCVRWRLADLEAWETSRPAKAVKAEAKAANSGPKADGKAA